MKIETNSPQSLRQPQVQANQEVPGEREPDNDRDDKVKTALLQKAAKQVYKDPMLGGKVDVQA